MTLRNQKIEAVAEIVEEMESRHPEHTIARRIIEKLEDLDESASDTSNPELLEVRDLIFNAIDVENIFMLKIDSNGDIEIQPEEAGSKFTLQLHKG